MRRKGAQEDVGVAVVGVEDENDADNDRGCARCPCRLSEPEPRTRAPTRRLRTGASLHLLRRRSEQRRLDRDVVANLTFQVAPFLCSLPSYAHAKRARKSPIHHSKSCSRRVAVDTCLQPNLSRTRAAAASRRRDASVRSTSSCRWTHGAAPLSPAAASTPPLHSRACAPRSAYPWGIVVIRAEDKLFFDKRDRGPFDTVSLNEDTPDPIRETSTVNPSNPNEKIPVPRTPSMNSATSPSLDATYINQNFSFQTRTVTRTSPPPEIDFSKPNLFYDPDDMEPLASCGYRYRVFDLFRRGPRCTEAPRAVPRSRAPHRRRPRHAPNRQRVPRTLNRNSARHAC